ncbi:hypothetical protein VOLCADRAFT_86320 [Volvox carteri f. nagariensis]|uniref:protein-serine/threonine phosphatase n=1 Tax=Volvox carteri f. nagariensis TaxID=3068 RepID=D8TIG5_VOLCA|nr:uncharacterized protein VOLCADRAFT_86320 [Volvox carteri f. nagariensis]EFJ52887.1 hypothetical protein VOLCADRAFT_86320 [Volvox carteri f. nagariensis]|eukprot:XP_002945892.1 hypothetical protein VOLCADRAFT_86320 [Volvox carteri f. nagariensis]
MAETNVTFVSGSNTRLPTQSVFDGYAERVIRLSFHVQGDPAAVPTIVTRDNGATCDSTFVPSQVFMLAPLVSVLRLSPTRETASSSGRPAARGHCARSSSSSSSSNGAVVPNPGPHLDVAGVSLPGYAPGYKDRNQDSALLLDTFLSNRQQLLAVFDGHGPEGDRVSAFVKRNLPYTLLTQLAEDGEETRRRGAAAVDSSEESRAAKMAASASPWTFVTSPQPTACSGGGRPAGGCGGGPLPRAMWRAVTSLDRQLEDSGIDVVNSGTTAALCHVHGRRVTAAWVGDSRMLLGLPMRAGEAAGAHASVAAVALLSETADPAAGGSGAANNIGNEVGVSGAATTATRGRARGGDGSWRVAWSSSDHKPELPEELQRIQAAGGRVARSVGRQGPVGPYRVWFQDQAYPGLAMSRALGDLPGREIGVTCQPSCASLRLPDSGPAVLVVASDGVWELMSNEKVLELAANASSAAEAASRVVQQSRRAWVKEYGGSYVDDITALVMRIDMPPRRASGH